MILTKKGIISTGGQKNDGGHDHRTNKGNDRTPSQKEGDEKRKKQQK
ncbi:hypothetical protein [Campylobacter mucosalis]|nr:hypothetical protein [Campylobacter mucosalis]